MLTACPASLIEGRAHETILEDGARRGVPRRRLVTAAPGGTAPRPPGTTTRTRGARCDRSGRNSGEGSAGPEPKIATVRAPGGERPALWDARRLARRLACRVTCRPNGCLASTRRLSALRHPFNRGSEAKVSKPGRRKRAAGTKRCCLVRTFSVGHSGRAAIAARAGIHNHRPWVWIPGSQASPAPRNDARKTGRENGRGCLQ